MDDALRPSQRVTMQERSKPRLGSQPAFVTGYLLGHALASGLKIDDVAVAMGLSRRTIFYHLAEARLESDPRFQAIARAIELNRQCNGGTPPNWYQGP
jgi:hypothetical protein